MIEVSIPGFMDTERRDRQTIVRKAKKTNERLKDMLDKENRSIPLP